MQSPRVMPLVPVACRAASAADRSRAPAPRSRRVRTPILRAALAALMLAAPVAAETIEVRPELALQGTAAFRTAVTARPGDTIRVDLPGQAGSGYAWSATLEGEALVPGRTETGVAARPGGPAREILTYRAAAPGIGAGRPSLPASLGDVEAAGAAGGAERGGDAPAGTARSGADPVTASAVAGRVR